MPSVFQAIGGNQAVTLAVDEFYARALAEPQIAAIGARIAPLREQVVTRPARAAA
jgi:truncated hemoglobin YjbI